MGKHRKARPQGADAGPPPPVAARDSNNAEEETDSVAHAKQPPPSFGPHLEALAQVLLDANAPAVGVDLRGRVTVWNRRLEDITGFHAERVLGRPITDFVYGAQRKREIQSIVDGCLRAKRPVLELRVPLLTTTGRNAEVLTNMTPLLAEDGACVGVYGVGQDVTEWAIQEKQYATVMMQANAPIIELDKEGNITVWNSKTASMTGYTSVDMVGEPLLPVVDRSFRKIVSEKIDQALSGIAGADFELPLVTARGSRVEIVLCLTPRFDTLGSVMGVVAIGQDVTERNTKEMEYRKLIDTANAPIFGVDTEGRVVIFNTKAAQISEYSPEEVMGVDLVETLISKDFRSEVAAVFQSAFQGIETANFEFPLVTKTGRKVEILLNATPRYDHTGQLVGVVGIGQDITDRIIQEKEYSRLIDTANAPIFGVDCNFEVIIWNEKAAAITDYTNEDTIGQKIFKFISEDYRDAVGKVLSKAMEGEGTANFDFPLITKHGHRLDILLNATPKYDHFGNISGAVGIGQDITDRRAQEQEYTRLIDTANAPIFGVDANGCVNIWNRKAAETTQYSNEEVLGVNLINNFIPEDFQEAVWTVLSLALEGKETANYEFPLITKDARRLEILLNATPRYNEKGVVIGVVGIGQDITIRMAQEKETNRLIHSANAPIFGVDQDGLVNIWNMKVAEITQFSSEEVMGRDLVNRFVAEDHRESVGLLLRKALQGEQTGNFDFPLITKTGRRVEILLNATPRYDELGQIFGVMGIGQDITERIAQEQEYIRLIDTANAPIFGVDSEGRVNIWNKKAAEIMQYTTDAVMGEKLVEKYITKDYQEAVSNVLSEALNGVETANFEFPLITKAGRRVEILLNATPRYNEHGAVIGMVGIGQDITDRIAQEQEYMRLIDTANAPIFGVDINGRVNIWNRKAAETTQYMNADVLGKDLVAEFISEEYKVPVRSVLEKAFEGVETANFEFPLITKAGRRVEILLNATPRYNEQGQVMGMVGIGQDITVRMAQEKEKNRMIHTANAPIFGVDQDGLVNIWNLKVAEITQFSSEEVMGQDLVNRFVAEDYREDVMSNLHKALKGEPTGNFDFPLITKTGRRVEILLNATPRYDELGQIFGVTGIGQDITERIAQEQEYIRLIDTANAPIFGVDSEGRVNIWNKKAAEIMQYTTDAVMGEKLVEKYITKDYQEAVSNVLSEALNGVETANFEFPLITKAGRRVEILLNATPRYNEHGAVIGMVGIGQDITDRIAQEQEYMRLIDTANAPIFGVDINGRVNIWNRKAAHIMQYTTEDVFGKDLVAEFISEEYKVPVRSVLEKAFEGVETANFEFPLITKAGRRVEILLNATPRYNEHGEVMGMVGIGQDITERIAQEQEHSRMIDTANAPIFGVDINGHVNIWNRKAADIMQYTNEDVLGKDLVAEFISNEYKVPVRSVLEKAFEGVETANFEFPLITKAGRRVEILLNATPRYNERGEVMGMVGIGQDITERIAQEQEYSRLIDTANAPIFGVDINGHVNIWNRKAADIMQYTNEDVLGKDLVAEFISNEYKVPVRSVLEKAFEGVETANFEFPLITKAGRRVEILLNATPRYNEHGEVKGMVGIGQDITERIAQEQEYSRLIDTANAPIFGVDADMRINIFNRKAEQTTNFLSQEVVGENVGTIISPEFKAMTHEIMCKALQARFDQHGQIVGVVGIGQDITDRIAQEQEYTRLIDSANAPIFGVDVNGCVNIWNKKAAEITQYTPNDVMGENLVEKFITEDYRDAVGLVLSKACEGTETANFEFPLMTKAGRRVEILLNATSRFNEIGEVMGVVGIGQDITERIAQEQEYTRLIDTANAPIFGVDINGRVNIWNRKAAEIMQYTTEDVLGKDLVAEFISREYKVPVRSVLEKAFEGVETANFEFPLITKAGRRVEILLNATPRYNEHGEVMGMVGIGQDITERIAQENEYTRLIDTANAPIFGVDINGHVNIWNRKAADIMQYTNEDVLGKDLVAEFISNEYKVPVRSVLEKAFEGVETANFEFPLITKAGRRVEILLNATPRYNERGEVMGMVGIGQDITERIAQEQEYSRLIDTANAPIFGVDINGHVNIWNRKAADIMQYTNEDVLGKDLVAEFISNEYKVPVRSVLEKAFEGVETANFEFPLITKAGRRVEILLNATPRYNEHGEVKGMVGIGQDITERIAQEHEYSRLIDTANAPIFGVDANMCVNIWNRKAAQITNYSIGEVMGENLVETFISPEFRPIVAEVLSQALTGVETANFEFPLITRPGTRIEILLNATPRYDLSGNIVGVVGIGQDITDRIAQEHEYFRLIDTANAPIFGIDTNGRINEWNQKIEEITGYHKSSVLGLSLVHTFITPECRQQVRQLLNQALIGIDVGEMELPMTTKRGVFLLLLVNASSKKDMHGNIRGVIGVGQDYTARKHMEAAKVNFLASFSHELRTPLNGVLGMLELLKEQPLDKSIERYVHMAYVSGSLLLNLINDILDLSKIEAGHLEITIAPFQMHDLLEYSIEIFKFKARERGLKLELKSGENVPRAVIGDVVRLRQVLLNLLSNAIKFTNEGSITVACSVVNSPDLPPQFRKLLFQVIDTGIGMDAEEKMRLFSLFTKLERTRQNNPTGSGLGLAICKQLAELMDGSIDVDSELGVGSNFFFTVVVRLIDEVDPKHAYYSSEDFFDPSLPILSDGSTRTGENSETASVRVEVPTQARILVVEDNEFNWEVVKCFLQQDDHLLQWEVNGRDAVKAYSENHTEFDLIFMDCEMPIMDGYTATATIREFEREFNLPRIPILGLTAYAMSGDRKKCLDCGMDEFMVKPISKLSLRKAIRQWMRIRYLGQQNAALGQIPGAVGHAPAALQNGSKPVKSPVRIAMAPPSAPTPMPSFENDLEDVTLMDAASTARLAPASRHMQQLDLAQAISNLELDDPMSIGLQSGRAVRTATPTTSIFSLGPSVNNNVARQTSSNDLPDLLRLSRNTSGASTASPPEAENPTSETSATLPYIKAPFAGETIPAQTGQRSSLPTNPTIWSHPPFNKKDLPAGRLESWSGLVPRKKVSFHEELDFESSHPSRGGHSSSSGSGMPSVLERMETGSSVEDEPPAVVSASQGEAAVSHSMDPMSIEIPEGDPVNYSLGVEQCGGHEELFMTLLEKFSTTSEAIASRVVEAHERNDFVTARREAHSLKGSSAYVAALRVSKCAFRVQVAYEHLMAQQANGEGSDTLAAKQIVDDSVKLLTKEQRLLRGYLRRNFEFNSHAGPSQAPTSQQTDNPDKPTGPCCVM
ncbi:hypothetical protein PR001_g10804 [Phytophthora rubi]|uniref:histidine kinase n=2 Tax=Phytophthora rubi TaxID=129364 RepID=A0A6A3MVU5_9STRA|nr:hypothetical protein PR002_g13629 [Phytophthora rubi]KAE9032014.1 hypothetical protein PR001_g10804 [Phytophthora rubi]